MTLNIVWDVIREEEKWIWCCYLRPEPSDLSYPNVFIKEQVLKSIANQKWYPYYCFYCYSCIVPGPGPETDFSSVI